MGLLLLIQKVTESDGERSPFDKVGQYLWKIGGFLRTGKYSSRCTAVIVLPVKTPPTAHKYPQMSNGLLVERATGLRRQHLKERRAKTVPLGLSSHRCNEPETCELVRAGLAASPPAAETVHSAGTSRQCCPMWRGASF